MKSTPRLWPIVLASALGIVFLCGLGVWQMQRLVQKNALIANLEQHMQSEPISLGVAIARQQAGEDIEYIKIQVIGVFDRAHALRKVSSVRGSPGWEIITPLKTDDGFSVLVDEGTIAENQTSSPADVSSQTIIGVARKHGLKRGVFDNDNDAAKNIWYWWDVPAMQVASASDGKFAPFILQKLPGNDTATGPQVQKPKVELSNNHMGYAITWFGLAAALAGVTGFYVLSLVKKSNA